MELALKMLVGLACISAEPERPSGHRQASASASAPLGGRMRQSGRARRQPPQRVSFDLLSCCSTKLREVI